MNVTSLTPDNRVDERKVPVFLYGAMKPAHYMHEKLGLDKCVEGKWAPLHTKKSNWRLAHVVPAGQVAMAIMYQEPRLAGFSGFVRGYRGAIPFTKFLQIAELMTADLFKPCGLSLSNGERVLTFVWEKSPMVFFDIAAGDQVKHVSANIHKTIISGDEFLEWRPTEKDNNNHA